MYMYMYLHTYGDADTFPGHDFFSLFINSTYILTVKAYEELDETQFEVTSYVCGDRRCMTASAVYAQTKPQIHVRHTDK